MPHRFQEAHWLEFVAAPFVPQGPFGRVPVRWAAKHGIAPQGRPLPNFKMTRQQVRAECRDSSKPVLHGYICAMAWGLQGAGKSNAHVAAAWCHRARIERLLTRLRAGGLSRRAAYDLFAAHPIPYLGPSYFTKLIYFFSPGDAPLGYIMDQWTGKSVNLITGNHVVRIYNDSPSSLNTGENYESFCHVVDLIARVLHSTGDETKQRLFSQGGLARGRWRTHILNNWRLGRPTHAYNHLATRTWVQAL